MKELDYGKNLGLSTVCFIDLGKLNLLIILLPWSKSVKQTVDNPKFCK